MTTVDVKGLISLKSWQLRSKRVSRDWDKTRWTSSTYSRHQTQLSAGVPVLTLLTRVSSTAASLASRSSIQTRRCTNCSEMWDQTASKSPMDQLPRPYTSNIQHRTEIHRMLSCNSCIHHVSTTRLISYDNSSAEDKFTATRQSHETVDIQYWPLHHPWRLTISAERLQGSHQADTTTDCTTTLCWAPAPTHRHNPTKGLSVGAAAASIICADFCAVQSDTPLLGADIMQLAAGSKAADNEMPTCCWHRLFTY